MKTGRQLESIRKATGKVSRSSFGARMHECEADWDTINSAENGKNRCSGWSKAIVATAG